MDKPQVTLLHSNTVPAPTNAGRQRPIRQANIAKVTSLLQQYDGGPVSLPELCRHAHVSERTLRSICKEVFGVGPHRYLHIRRLHLVRMALLIAHPQTDSVGQVALRLGFSDSGRMASDYHRLFGEYPSETLLRQSP